MLFIKTENPRRGSRVTDRDDFPLRSVGFEAL